MEQSLQVVLIKRCKYGTESSSGAYGAVQVLSRGAYEAVQVWSRGAYGAMYVYSITSLNCFLMRTSELK